MPRLAPPSLPPLLARTAPEPTVPRHRDRLFPMRSACPRREPRERLQSDSGFRDTLRHGLPGAAGPRRRRPPTRRPPSARLLVTLALACCALAGVAGCTDAGYRVDRVEVFDGDSFTARDSDGRKVEIRLFGIDAPERRQPWNRRSRQALRELVRGQSLELRIVTVDRYERLVAEAWLPDGRSLAEAQVAAGHAWVYRRYTDDPGLLVLEDEARRERRGLWSLPGHERMPPWQWRERARHGR